ncbi:MAG: DUF3810 domain-containing protein [Oscillospiraceae bacterium]|nr:DUF3810 domain-containing protein [Oscillospiraceae bacterium]
MKKHKALHIWLGVATGLLVLFLLLRYVRPVMNFWVFSVALSFRQGMGRVTGLVRFSVAELIVLLLLLTMLGLLIREIVRIRRKKQSLGAGLYRMVAGCLAIVVTVISSFSLLYGANFYADNFQERTGIFAQDATVEDLERVTVRFAEGLNNTAHLVVRDEAGVVAVPIQQMFNESIDVFRPLEDVFPFLTMRDRLPKPLAISPFMALTDYVGFYFPFTGEANINTLMPLSQMPSTILHEFAHQRGISSENEANFVAILAGVKSDNPTFAYSAYLMGYNYLANALNRVAPERFQAIHATLPNYVHADLDDIRAYHARRNPVAQRVTNIMNDHMLRSYGEASGVQSYGEVVDLLIAYF